MWWAGVEPVDLYLGGGRWRLSGADGLEAAGPAEGADGGIGGGFDSGFGTGFGSGTGPKNAAASTRSVPHTPGPGLQQLLDEAVAAWPSRGSPRAPGRLWLGGDLARPFLLPRPPPRSALRARDDILQGAARQVFDGTTPCRVWVAPGGLGPEPSGQLGVAAPMAVVQAIETWCAHHRIPLRRLAPWWSQVFDAWSRAAEGRAHGPSDRALWARDRGAGRPGPDGARDGVPVALAVYDAATLTMLAAQGGRFTRVRSATGVDTLDDARALWTRAIASLDPAPQRVALLALQSGARARVIDGASGQEASSSLHASAFPGPWNFRTERCDP